MKAKPDIFCPQRDCNSWVESCKILLKIIQKSREHLFEQPEQPSISTESAESMETQVKIYPKGIREKFANINGRL